MEKIKCSVGILTFNSEKGIEKCLESIKDFAEIIIADGGSTDRTLDIAKKYGAKVISQTNPGHPIEDFSKERQQLLDSSIFDWFFYLDSDEVATPELVKKITEVVSDENPKYLIYKVKYQLSTEDFSIRYVSFKPYYQTRFFNKKSNAFFIKKVHERISFDKLVPVGIIDEPWLVPLSDQLEFKIYKQKVQKRLKILVDDIQLNDPIRFLVKGIINQIILLLKQLYKMFALRLRENKRIVVPFKYEIYRLYSPVVTSVYIIKRYFTLKIKK